VAALAAVVAAYRRAPVRVLWRTPATLKMAQAPVVALAFGLVVSGLTTPNPTIVGAERLFDRPDCVRGVLRVTRNSFLWGASTWAVVHLIGTGDVAGVLAFGGVAALGIAGSVVLDRKKARRHPAAWRRFKQRTSNVPFAAIAGGRQRLAFGEIGWWRLAIAAGLFGAALAVHGQAFGVSPVR
jgi:uncharacterized membrane protein